jgi:hypothetical protein
MPDFIKVVNMIPNLSSGETNQDSEPSLAVNPVNHLEMAGTAFTPSPNLGSPNSPVYYSTDGGNIWALKDLIAGTPVRDQTLRFASTSGMLYAGVLWGGGNNIALINFDILRTNNFSGSVPMDVMAQRKNDDQPFIQAATVPAGAGAGKDRIYVGSNDHAPANIPSTLDLSLDATAAAPITKTFRLEQRAVARDGFQTRPAIHSSGVVYAAYYALIGSAATCDVVVVRDDDWGSGATPFMALIDTGDLKQGVRIAQGVNNPFLGLFIGQQRIGGDLSITVDPNDSARVYVCFGDQQGGVYRLRVWKSIDSGANWIQDLRIVDNATNPALAINSHGRVGFLYQQVIGTSSQRWLTTVELTEDDFGSFQSHTLANTPATTPAKAYDPYLGDYLYMMAADRDFYGIFCANNTPDHANFPNGVSYQRNANFSTHTLLANDNITPVAVSIDPFFFKVTHGFGKVVTAIAHAGKFGNVCLGSFADELLTINNSGTALLSITNILSSSPDFLTPDVLAYPIKISPGASTEVVIRFQPVGGSGPKAGVITVISNDPHGPHKIPVSGDALAPRLNLVIANHGNFGKVCVGSFADEPLILNNGGKCALSITDVTSSSIEFQVPLTLSYPLSIAGGDSLPLPIRFAPTSFGFKSANITVMSNDPTGSHSIDVTGDAPAGKLAVTGSLCFGGVKACCRAERTVSICNVGDCSLHVTSVAFKRKSHYWKLINNPFPATLHPGSCLGVVIRYLATQKCPVCCELVITSDDPMTPIKTLDVMAYTIWNQCSCAQHCDDCKKGCCEKSHSECCCEGSADDCCEEDSDSHEG